MNSINNFNPIALFVKNTHYEQKDIRTCTKIKKGFSNLSYHLITMDGQEFQVRFGQNNDTIFRSNEQAIMVAINLDVIYYNPENGDSIRRWCRGINPTVSDINHTFLKLLVDEIEKIHRHQLMIKQKLLPTIIIVFDQLLLIN